MIRFAAFSFIPVAVFGLTLCTFAATEISDGSVVGVWHFNDDSVDSSGNGRNGTAVGTTFVAGKLSTAASFDGGDYTYVNSVIAANNISYCAWIKTSQVANAMVAAEYDTISGTGFTMRVNNNGYIANKVAYAVVNFGVGGPANSNATSTSDINDGSWHFVCGTNENGSLKLYFDNALQGAQPAGSGTNTDGKIAFGGEIYGGALYDAFNGQLDEMVITSSTLSTTTINSLWNGGAGSEVCTTVGCAVVATSSYWVSSQIMTTSTDAIVGNVFGLGFLFLVFFGVCFVGYIVYKIVS